MKLFITICLWVFIVGPALQYWATPAKPVHYYHAVVRNLLWSCSGLIFVGASGLVYDFVGWWL